MSQAVPDKVLSWLYSVLQEYRDAQRVYTDVVRALSTYPTLAPRTEVYTYENATSALLLTLSGTLPVPFRGTTYRFPVKLWIQHAYPQDAPIVYVTPGREMLIRPGQHVGVDGRVYHPYLSDWMHMWDRANVTDLCNTLSQVFAKEPPVISRAQQQQYQRPLGPVSVQTPEQPQPHFLPPKQDSPGSALTNGNRIVSPPPLPPKPGDGHRSSLSSAQGPPPPSLPQSSTPPVAPYGNGVHAQPGVSSQPFSNHYRHDRNSAHGQRPPDSQQQSYEYRPDQAVAPASQSNGFAATADLRHSRPAPLPAELQSRANGQHSQLASQPPYPMQPVYPTDGQQYRSSQNQAAPQYYTQSIIQPQSQATQKQPVPDLLSDAFDVALPGLSSNGAPAPAPPIPPNPEKEHLLQALSTALTQQAEQRVAKTMSAIAPLQAQQAALHAARSQLDAEIRQLEQLDQALTQNEAILHRSIQDCDTTIAAAKQKTLPPIDDVLVASTLVANQLWTLCAEEAACREAMYVLQKAVDKGRVSGEVFVRQMRALGREAFLKKALAQKCAQGMGLDIDR